MYTSTNVGAAPRDVRYTVQPDPITADADDDFGFGIVDEDFTDNQKRNPVSGQDSLDPSALASNYSFTGLTNISNACVPLNIAYGEILVGSIVVSNGVDTVQVEGTN